MPTPVATRAILLVFAFGSSACSSRSAWPDEQTPPPPNQPAACTQGREGTGTGAPADIGRHEPAERVDRCNVTIGAPESTLALPPPPKSGFRVVIPPRVLAPGEEALECVALAYPDFQHKNVYAARLYTSGYLHHSNLTGAPFTKDGPSPYPACSAGQGDPDAVHLAVNLLKGETPDVLFTNSTQVRKGEDLVFPEGMAYKLDTDGRELIGAIHWLNTTGEEVTSEIVYDFFTMPDEMVETELVSLVYENRSFEIPARSTRDISTTCNLVSGAKIVSILPHAHKRTNQFKIDLIGGEGVQERLFEDGTFTGDSDILVFDEPVDLAGFTKINYTCTVDNDLDVPITWGVGDNEMCMIFGYMYPKSAQQMGITYEGTNFCTVVDIGRFRK